MPDRSGQLSNFHFNLLQLRILESTMGLPETFASRFRHPLQATKQRKRQDDFAKIRALDDWPKIQIARLSQSSQLTETTICENQTADVRTDFMGRLR